jgi:transcriptional regulator
VYIPEYHRIEDRAESLAFMQANPFAILISAANDGPFATHIPVIVRQLAGQVVLRAHVARSNPHWKVMEDGQQPESLIIFHGPHAYISPTLYENRESVPTWNYAAVHMYGRGKILDAESEVRLLLLDLISQFDSSYQEQWLSLRPEYQARMLSHIVAFEITATRIETKFKLSQNRTKADQENVIQSLASSPDSAVSGVAALMRQQGLGRP